MHALAMRSELGFFRDLYRDSVAGYRVSGIETDETDDNLKEWALSSTSRRSRQASVPVSHVR